MAAAAPKTLAEALLAFQSKALTVSKDARNPHFGNKYISLDKLVPQVLPLLNEQGLVLTQMPSSVFTEGGHMPALTTRLTHAPSGEFIESTLPLMLDKNNSQGVGSAITYARRYMLLSFLGLVADEDDDGEKASRREVVVVNRRTTKKSATTRKKKAEPVDDTDGY